MIRFLITLFTLTLPVLALGEAAEHSASHEAIEIPKTIIYQIINFILVLGLLYFLLKKKVVDFFGDRKAQYLDAVNRFEKARNEAEMKASEIRMRLEKLEASSAHSIQQARQEAQQLQTQIVAEAQSASQKLQAEAKKTASVEVVNAVAELREEVLRQSTEAARSQMLQQMKENDQRRLQQEFVDKIQVVQQ
jgi:F-type H+-transporting ATPase subunit b